MSTIHRFYLSPELAGASALALTDREAHHALDVLRLRDGDALVVQDGAGNEFQCVIRSHTRKRVELTVKEKKFTPPPACPITLLAAVPKGKMEIIVEKATELGVARIIPLLTERTVVNIVAKEAAAKVEKWRQVAIEAVKQCGSPWLPKLELPQTPAEFLAREEIFELPLIASLQAERRHPRKIFASYRMERGRLPKSVSVWVGPEGDFTPQEYADIQNAGVLPISLGPLVLRADTAVIACLAVVNHEVLEGR